MNVYNNLNQLLSRVKTLFGHKAPHEVKFLVSPIQDPPFGDHHRQTALSGIENYLDSNHGTTSSAITYKEYTNGAGLESKDPTFSTAVVALTSTGGMLNLPNAVKTDDVTCIRLY